MAKNKIFKKYGMFIIIGIVLIAVIGYFTLLNKNCEDHTFSTCPEGCFKKCISSGCTTEDDHPICTMDCGGAGSCRTKTYCKDFSIDECPAKDKNGIACIKGYPVYGTCMDNQLCPPPKVLSCLDSSCAGIAGIKCPEGYICMPYPGQENFIDAGGHCELKQY